MSDTASSSNRQPRSGIFWNLGLTLIVLVVLFVGLIWFWSHLGNNAAEERLAVIRQAGEPISLAELDAYYAMPQGLNAADAYLAAFELMTFENQTVESADLEKNAQAIAMLIEAGRAGQARFPLDLTQPLDANLPHGGQLRQAGRLLDAYANNEAALSRTDTATDALIAHLRLGDALALEPLLISQLVRISLHHSAARSIVEVLPLADFDDAQLQRIAEALQAADDSQPLVRGLIGDRAYGLSMFGEAVIPVIQGHDTAAYLNVSDAAIEIARDIDHRNESIDAQTEDLPKYALRAGLLIPALDASVRSERQRLATLRAARIAIAAKRYQLKNNAWPRNPEAMTPAYLSDWPIDPFNGQPMLMSVTDNGFTAYSVGPDGDDDDGQPIPPGGAKANTNGDVVFVSPARSGVTP